MTCELRFQLRENTIPQNIFNISSLSCPRDIFFLLFSLWYSFFLTCSLIIVMIAFALNTLRVLDAPTLPKVISPYKKFKSPMIEIFT